MSKVVDLLGDKTSYYLDQLPVRMLLEFYFS